MDAAVLGFTALLAVAVGLLVGAVPALQWSRLPLVRILNEGSAQSAGGFGLLRANRARALLATAQVALALVLLVGAGLLLRSFVELVAVDPGYDPANVLTARVANPDLGSLFFAGPVTAELIAERTASSRRFYGALRDRLAQMERLPRRRGGGALLEPPLRGRGARGRSRVQRRRAARAGRSGRSAAGPRADGHAGLLRRDAAAPSERTHPRPSRRSGRTARGGGERDPRRRGLRRRAGGGRAPALRARRRAVDGGRRGRRRRVPGPRGDGVVRGDLRVGGPERGEHDLEPRRPVRLDPHDRRSRREPPVPARGGRRRAPARARRRRDDHGRAAVSRRRPAPRLLALRRFLRRPWRCSSPRRGSTGCSATPSRSGGGRSASAWPSGRSAATSSR